MKKKNYLLFLLISILVSCNSKEEVFTTHDVWVMGFKALSMDSDRDHCSTRFLFFKKSILSEIDPKSYTANDFSEFGKIKDPIFFNLADNGFLKTKDGNIIYPVFDIYVSEKSETYGTVTIPVGKYVVFAVSRDVNYPARSQAALKYCMKEIEVKERTSELILSPTFPTTYSMYGLVLWVDVSEKFSYNWK